MCDPILKDIKEGKGLAPLDAVSGISGQSDTNRVVNDEKGITYETFTLHKKVTSDSETE